MINCFQVCYELYCNLPDYREKKNKPLAMSSKEPYGPSRMIPSSSTNAYSCSYCYLVPNLHLFASIS